MAKTILLLIVAVHAIIAIINLLAILFLPFLAPWYISVPLLTLLINLSFNENQCVLTRLEDSIRRRSGKPEIYHFTAHYFLSPFYSRLKRVKKLFSD